ncbi:MAG: DUF5683 domain-containing protein [Candidatus Coprenecus sp.]
MRKLLYITLLLLCSFFTASAQFGQDRTGGGASVNDTSSVQQEETYSVKRYFNSLAHRDTMSISWAFGGSMILPGTGQIYNKDYWKLPVLYAGLGGCIGGGIYFNQRYQASGNPNHKLYRNLFIAGAALFYWGQLMDVTVCYRNYKDHLPGRATIYSMLFPGLGQIYNREYWKLPIYYGGLAASGYFWYYNNLQYTRFRAQYNKSVEEGGIAINGMSTENLKYYRDYYRRFRDYAVVITVAVYILQIIDADVFATMHNFDLNNKLSMEIEPAVINPINYEFNTSLASTSPLSGSFGMQLKLTF